MSISSSVLLDEVYAMDDYHNTFRRVFAITANSRMMYAFARDGGLPGHNFFHNVHGSWRSPIRTGVSFGISFYVFYGLVTDIGFFDRSVARMRAQLHTRTSESGKHRGSLSRDIHLHYRSLHILWSISSVPFSSEDTCLIMIRDESHRHSYRTPPLLLLSLPSRTFPSRPALFALRCSICHLDLLHHNRIPSPGAESSQLTDAQLRGSGCWRGAGVFARVLDAKCEVVVQRAGSTN